MADVNEQELEWHRDYWHSVAEKNGWATDPFYVQVWTTSDGHVVDSVSFMGMTGDIVLDSDSRGEEDW